jgi:serine/threonine protein kinase
VAVAEVNPPDPARVDRVFARALDQPPRRRPRFLARACGGDLALRAAVERLLQAELDSRAAFEASLAENQRRLAEITGDAGPAGAPSREGQRLGPFRLLRRIGQGGMAVVYLGEREDGAFRQQVAVKLLRRNVDAADDIARFDAERRILSRLRHPNIARLVDGGTTPDGVPYLVTEFIDGLPITDYCRQRGLGVEARLDLFLQVADAVHHAHQALVVHRDLKPSNVMVAGDGRVVLLDFGIAKLVDPADDDAAPRTRTGLRVMTPEYAAPEQRAGTGVTTATDVFQLGVLLFELLTGTRPPPGGKDDAPPRASVVAGLAPALARRLRGDLDQVLQCALQPEPARRYASAAAFASDVRNHLRHRPIAARPEGSLATLRRLARRSPWAARALALSALLLVGWLASLHWLSLELSRERDAAQAQSVRAQRAYQLLLDLFRQADPLARDGLGGQGATLWDSLDAATDNVRATLRDEPRTLADVLSSLAGLYRAAERPAQARELLIEALALYQRTAGPTSAPAAVALAELGSVEAAMGRSEPASAYLAQAVRIARDLPPREALDAVSVHLDAGHTAIGAGDALAASRHYQDAESLLRGTSHPDANALVEALFGLANALSQLGEHARAEAPAQESVRLAQQVYGETHSRLAGPLSALAGVQRALGRYGEAASNLRRALVIMERDYGPGHAGVLGVRNNLALALGAAGDRAGEQAELRRLIAAKEAQHGRHHATVADHYQNLGASLGKSGDTDAALEVLAVAQRIYDEQLPPGSPRRAFPRLSRAQVLLDRGEPAPAEVAAREAGDILVRTLPAGHFAIGIADCLRAEARIAQGDAEGGVALAAKALPAVERAPADQAAYLARCRALTASSATPG